MEVAKQYRDALKNVNDARDAIDREQAQYDEIALQLQDRLDEKEEKAENIKKSRLPLLREKLHLLQKIVELVVQSQKKLLPNSKQLKTKKITTSQRLGCATSTLKMQLRSSKINYERKNNWPMDSIWSNFA